MKICFVVNECDFFYSHRLLLAQKLTADADVTLLTDTSRTSSKIIHNIHESGIKIHELASRSINKGLFGHLSYLLKLHKSLKAIKPSHVFFVTLEISFFGALISWLNKNIYSFYLITGVGPYFLNSGLKNKIIFYLYKLIFISKRVNKNTKYIFQNNENKALFLSNGFAHKEQVELIHGSGIEIEEIKFKLRDGKGPLSFLFASRLIKSKGLVEFVEAALAIKKLHPMVIINIAGNLDLKDSDIISDELFSKIKHSREINYLGNLDYDDMQEQYQNSDIFVLPSYSEGLPKAAIEAAASGMPLILSRTSGCLECINAGENGSFVEINDSKSIQQAMEFFIKNPQNITQMSKYSRELANKKFALSNIYPLYKKLIA
jgi:glycosyltransferase involved in cell wall biosynthesis